MKPTRKNKPQRFPNTGKEPFLSIKEFLGLNLFDDHSALVPGQFLEAWNIDLYKGAGFKDRKGSSNLNDISSTLDSEPVLAGDRWDVGEKEYAIIQCDVGGSSKMRYVELSADGVFHDVLFKGTVLTATLATDEAATLFISGGKCYVFHPSGNYIIEYLPSTDTFEMRTNGLQYPTISSVAAVAAGNKTGKFTYAVEEVYEQDGVIVQASSPSRKLSTGALATITLTGENAQITIDSASLPSGGGAGDYYTGFRLFKSDNQHVDFTSGQASGPDGTEDDLYFVKYISKADLIAASYVITDDVDDDVIDRSEVWSFRRLGGISRVELLPLPAGKFGCVHKTRIWVGGCLTEDPEETTLYYSNFSGSEYSEQYDPIQRVPCESGDGQKIIKVMPFESSLVVLKDGKTGYVPDGNPDLGFSTVDHTQGIKHRRLCQYVPNVGICAITTDNSDLKILNSSLRWVNIYGSQDISRMVRPLTKEIAENPDFVSFTFVNGKLKIYPGDAEALVLHVDQGLGWTQYEYQIAGSGAELVLTFDGNSREVIISSEAYLVETELDIDTDLDTTTGLTNPVQGDFILHRFQDDQGRSNLEFSKLSISATLDSALEAIPYINGQAHPLPELPTATACIPDPAMYDDTPELKEGVYELFLRKRPIAPYQHFAFSTTAPFSVRSIEWHGWIQTGVPQNIFNRFRKTKNSTQFPAWIVNPASIYDAFDDARTVADFMLIDAEDSDGNDRDVANFTIIDRA